MEHDFLGLFQRKVSGSNVPNSSGKMKWYCLGSFKKHGLCLDAMYFFTTLVCKLMGIHCTAQVVLPANLVKF